MEENIQLVFDAHASVMEDGRRVSVFFARPLCLVLRSVSDLEAPDERQSWGRLNMALPLTTGMVKIRTW